MNTMLIAVTALIGLSASAYLLYGRKKKVSLMCPRKGCDAVVGSKYGVTFGVHNDALGALYYGVWIVICALLFGGVLIPFQILLIYAMVGAFMSVRLVSIQAFVLRTWCLWCLVSALASFMIVILL